MDLWLNLLTGWFLRFVFCGSFLLFVCWLIQRRMTQPALRQRLGELGIFAALSVPVLSLLPSWLLVPSVVLDVFSPPNIEHLEVPTPPGNQTVWIESEMVWHEGQNIEMVPVFGNDIDSNPHVNKVDGETLPVEDGSPSLSTMWQFLAPRLWTMARLAAFTCLLISMIMFLRLLLGVAYVFRLLLRCEPAPEHITELLTTDRPVRVLQSSYLQVPISFGLLNPTIVFPTAMCRNFPKEHIHWILRHEMTHIRRHDSWSGLLCGLGSSCYFFLPWFWAITRQVRLSQEFIADASVIDEPAKEPDYAEFLLRLTRMNAAPDMVTGVSGTSSDLYRRVSMLLQKPVTIQQQCPRRWWMPAAVCLFTLAIIGSGLGIGAQADAQQVIVTRVQTSEKFDNQKNGDKSEAVYRVFVVPAKEENVTKKIKVLVVQDQGKNIQVEAIPQDVLPKIVVGKKSDKDSTIVIEKIIRVAPKNMIWKEKDGDKRIEIEVENDSPKIFLWQDKDGVRKIIDGKIADSEKLLKKTIIRQNVEGKEQNQNQEKRIIILQKVDKGFAELDEALKKLEGKLSPDQTKKIRAAIENAMKQVPNNVQMQRFELVVPQKVVQPKIAQDLIVSQPPGRLGVAYASPSDVLADHLNLEKNSGILVTKVFPKTPAEKVGFQANDVIVEFASQKVTRDLKEFVVLIRDLPAKKKVNAVVIRKGKRRTLKGIELGAAPEVWQLRVEPKQGFKFVPKPPQPPKVALPPVKGKFLVIPQAPKAPAAITVKGSKDVNISTFRNNDRFNTRYQEGSLIITVSGTVKDGKAAVSEIHVQDGDNATKFQSVDAVPKRYRAKVDRILEVTRSNAVKVEFRN